MKTNDQTLYCERCGISFLWTAEEQKQNNDAPPAKAPIHCPGCRQLLPAHGRERGLVKFYDLRRRFGFLVRKDHPDLFAHGSAVQGERRLRPGDLVEFAILTNERGPYATDIRVIGHLNEELA